MMNTIETIKSMIKECKHLNKTKFRVVDVLPGEYNGLYEAVPDYSGFNSMTLGSSIVRVSAHIHRAETHSWHRDRAWGTSCEEVFMIQRDCPLEEFIMVFKWDLDRPRVKTRWRDRPFRVASPDGVWRASSMEEALQKMNEYKEGECKLLLDLEVL